MLFDAHTHVDSGIPGNLCAVCREDWDRVLETSGMVPFLGVHPWYAAGVDAVRLRKDLDGYLEMFPRAQVGECGLDASPKFRGSLPEQVQVLDVQLESAFRYGRSVHLHGSQAWGRLIDMLRERGRRKALPPFLLHAWNGSPELAKEAVKLGGRFSVGVRELGSPKAAERLRCIPQELLAAESDDDPASLPEAVRLLQELAAR